jgi:hypothetical protein
MIMEKVAVEVIRVYTTGLYNCRHGGRRYCNRGRHPKQSRVGVPADLQTIDDREKMTVKAGANACFRTNSSPRDKNLNVSSTENTINSDTWAPNTQAGDDENVSAVNAGSVIPVETGIHPSRRFYKKEEPASMSARVTEQFPQKDKQANISSGERPVTSALRLSGLMMNFNVFLMRLKQRGSCK